MRVEYFEQEKERENNDEKEKKKGEEERRERGETQENTKKKGDRERGKKKKRGSEEEDMMNEYAGVPFSPLSFRTLLCVCDPRHTYSPLDADTSTLHYLRCGVLDLLRVNNKKETPHKKLRNPSSPDTKMRYPGGVQQLITRECKR